MNKFIPHIQRYRYHVQQLYAKLDQTSKHGRPCIEGQIRIENVLNIKKNMELLLRALREITRKEPDFDDLADLKGAACFINNCLNGTYNVNGIHNEYRIYFDPGMFRDGILEFQDHHQALMRVLAGINIHVD